VKTLAKNKVLIKLNHRLGTNNLHHYHSLLPSYHAIRVISEKPEIIQYIERKMLQRLVGYLTTLSAPKTVSRAMTEAGEPERIWKETIVA